MVYSMNTEYYGEIPLAHLGSNSESMALFPSLLPSSRKVKCTDKGYHSSKIATKYMDSTTMADDYPDKL